MTIRALTMSGLLLLLAGVRAQAEPAGTAPEASPLEILQSAFDRMFNYPSVRSIQLRIHRRGHRVTYWAFDLVYKKVDGRGRTLLRFTEPEYLRGNALLVLEVSGGQNDTWIYQKELRRPRRVVSAQKGDSFYGSDLSFEDLEHHDWREFELKRLPDSVVRHRKVHVIDARAPARSQYAHLRAFVEKGRRALLRLDLFKEGHEPVKSFRLEPEEIHEEHGLLKPERMWVVPAGRDASTEVVFRRIEDDPDITDSVFATMRLERSGENLFELVERLRRGGAH